MNYHLNCPPISFGYLISAFVGESRDGKKDSALEQKASNHWQFAWTRQRLAEISRSKVFALLR